MTMNDCEQIYFFFHFLIYQTQNWNILKIDKC